MPARVVQQVSVVRCPVNVNPRSELRKAQQPENGAIRRYEAMPLQTQATERQTNCAQRFAGVATARIQRYPETKARGAGTRSATE